MNSKAVEDFTEAAQPEPLFSAWFDEAERAEINDANAMSLATVDASGLPNVRVVLLKGLDPRGFVFYGNAESAKGQELLANPKAALCFYWKSLRRQVRVRGTVEQVSTAEADAYYASRPMGSRIGAWASQQSRPLESREVLKQAVARFEEEFEGLTRCGRATGPASALSRCRSNSGRTGRSASTTASCSPAKARTRRGPRPGCTLNR
jgi:pyridoxamine 5'-phosphate oxidase